MDGQICTSCGTFIPAYMPGCETCKTDLAPEPQNEETGEFGNMFQSANLDEERTQSKTIDNLLLVVMFFMSIFGGGILWYIAAAVIHFIFRKQEHSWLFFIVPWVLLQIIAFALWR